MRPTPTCKKLIRTEHGYGVTQAATRRGVGGQDAAAAEWAESSGIDLFDDVPGAEADDLSALD